MPVEISSLLTLQHVRSAPFASLLASVRSWLIETDPVCLMHPHGFFVVLLRRSGQEDWRFHWWPLGPRHLTGMPAMIHTHDKIVESRILQGQLRNITYDVSEDADGGQPVYEVGYRGDKYLRTTANVLQKTATRARAELRDACTLNAGDCYRIGSHVYHEAVVPEHTATATLVCMHAPAPGPVRVLGLDGYPDHIEFQRTECRATECLGFL